MSANASYLIVMFVIRTPTSGSLLSTISNVTLNRVGERGSPCTTPLLMPIPNTSVLRTVYTEQRYSTDLLSSPAAPPDFRIALWNTESKTFLKSNNDILGLVGSLRCIGKLVDNCQVCCHPIFSLESPLHVVHPDDSRQPPHKILRRPLVISNDRAEVTLASRVVYFRDKGCHCSLPPLT